MARIRLRAAMAIVAAVVLGPGAPAFADGLKVGVVTSMTGALQEFGPTTLNGVNLAVGEVNAAGGVLGGKMQVVVADDQTSPQQGVAAARKLIDFDGVKAIIGSLSSGVTIPIAQSVTSTADVPQISTASTSPVITQLADSDYLFRTVPTDALQGVALAQVCNQNGVKSVAIIYVNNDYGKGLADSFGAAFEKLGGTVTERVPYEAKQASYRGEVQKAASGHSAHLLLIAYPQDGIPILRQALESGQFQHFIFTDGMKSTDMVKAIGGKNLVGAFGTAPESSGTAHARFRAAYEKKYGALPPKPFIDSAYDAAMIFALAAVKAGSDDSTKIRDAMRAVSDPPGTKIYPGEFAKAKKLLAEGKDIDYQGAAGPQDFDSHGDVAGTYGYWVVANDKLVTKRVFVPQS